MMKGNILFSNAYPTLRIWVKEKYDTTIIKMRN